MVMQEAIRALVEGDDFPPGLAASALQEMMSGNSTPAQIGAFLAALRVRGETAEVLAACLAVTEAHAEPVLAANVIDIVGTGGDGADTFNVSTAAAIVVAATGVRVAKHGNRAASSKCGSADVLEALGARLDLSGEQAAGVIDACGFCFLFAQRFHPAFRHVGPARREMGTRTIFNILGPLANPARPRRMLVGAGVASIAPLLARTFALRSPDRVMVVHSEDGLDEISPAALTRAWVIEGSHITEMPLTPELFGLPRHPLSAVGGGDAGTNASTMRRLLDGQAGPVRDFVVMNAAAALWVAGTAADFRTGATSAAAAIDSGKAKATLEAYVRLSQAAGSG